ncbi:MAG: DUF86 domain-containing protein [Chloroflexi bacterium]|nr:DUF86 domain-containing protein [Chloroflexota bacterium]
MNPDRLYLTHISESIADIEVFVAEGKEEFFTSRKTQAAVLYRLQTLAESTQRLSENLKARHPEVDWVSIRGFRNRLVHDYLNTNLNVVWNVVENFLPPLKMAVQAMLASLQDDTISSADGGE